ncbi:hypothetical protein UUU_33030 [Klebsiella pneumoniae subsp. pneumoniae DSM 30104 = JCM 1662 = NBRC 14940]|nr:hypothetical protein UUU_33030 [Klebsiella pneumoniae subsp. pneumoniae DSM 30104 = JCM 1662 = NBRC 14940]
MKAADAFYRHDFARRQPGNSRLQRRLAVQRFPLCPPFQSRPAVGAGHRLGVKTAIGRIAEFRLTRGTERERRHCGEGPVVGHGANNGQPRAAVGAVDKGVAVAACPGIVHLREARRAGRGIGHNLSPHPSRPTLADGEILRRGRPAIGNAGGTVDPRQRRAVVSQSGSKTVVAPDQPHQYAVAVVTDIAAAGLRPGQLPDKGAEPHPLHFTANADLHPVHALTYQASAVRRRFSIFICSSLLRSTHTRACVGHTSMQAGPLSRWKQRSHLLASAFSATTFSPAPLWRITGRTTTSIAPYGQATTQVLQPMQRSCITWTKPLSRLMAPFGQTLAQGASSH